MLQVRAFRACPNKHIIPLVEDDTIPTFAKVHEERDGDQDPSRDKLRSCMLKKVETTRGIFRPGVWCFWVAEVPTSAILGKTLVSLWSSINGSEWETEMAVASDEKRW